MKSLFDKYFRDDPPNLDEIFKNFAKKIKNKRKDQLENPNGPIYGLASAVFLLFFIIWFLSGIHIISPSDRGVVLRFGAYNRTLLPGPSWVPSIIDRVYLVNVTRDYSLKQKAEMLTKDKNIVDVELSVVFRVVDANKYLFSAVNPLDSVNQATASALRQVVGNTTLDGILTQQRAMVRDEAEKQIIETVNTYDIGIEIIDVNLEPARPPQQVSAAFDDAIKALEDEKRYINEAKAYREKVVPIARGQAKRILEESRAYELSTVLESRARVASFLAIYKDYQQAPEIMGKNLYLGKMSKLYHEINKIVVDLPSNQNPFIYLPIDKLAQAPSVKSTDLQHEVAELSTNVSPRNFRYSHNDR